MITGYGLSYSIKDSDNYGNYKEKSILILRWEPRDIYLFVFLF